MKVILFIFSFLILGLAWYTMSAGGVIPQGRISWRWMEDHSITLGMDYRVMILGLLIALPFLLFLFRKRG